jgi:hypothetical protein
MDDNTPNGAPNNNNHVPNNYFIEVPMHICFPTVTWSDGFIRSYVKQRTSPPPYRTVHNN